jgi:hypothetical protein
VSPKTCYRENSLFRSGLDTSNLEECLLVT